MSYTEIDFNWCPKCERFYRADEEHKCREKAKKTDNLVPNKDKFTKYKSNVARLSNVN